jgi:hypothetical protein
MTTAATILTRALSPQNPNGPARGGRIADSAITATTPSAAQGLRDAPSPAVPGSFYRPPAWRVEGGAEGGARSTLPSQARVALSPAAPSLDSDRFGAPMAPVAMAAGGAGGGAPRPLQAPSRAAPSPAAAAASRAFSAAPTPSASQAWNSSGRPSPPQAPSQALQEAVSQPDRAAAAPTAPAAAAEPGKSPWDGTPRHLRPSEAPETGGQAATGAKERATQRGARTGWAGASADSDGGGLRVDARAPPAPGTSSRGGVPFGADGHGAAGALGRLRLSQEYEPQTAAATAQGLARESAVGPPTPLAAAEERTGAVGDSDAEAEWQVVGARGVAGTNARGGRRGRRGRGRA